MLYSTHIYRDNDRVRALAYRVGGKECPADDALRLSASLVELARFWKAKLELADRATPEYDSRFQPYILTERGDWVPVDHILWRTPAGRQVKLEFSGGRAYLQDGEKPLQHTWKRARAYRLMASAIRRLALGR